jgi:hypothetical protein
MPSFAELVSFKPQHDGFSITYRTKPRPYEHVLRFVNGKWDQPLEYVGGNLLVRMRSMKSAWRLPTNFMGDLDGTMEEQAAHPQFRLRSKPDPELPASLPALESALRAEIQRDSTQPWHLFFLGQTLLAEGRGDEANATWSEMLARDFPVPYTNWTWISKLFERFGQRAWADRAWEKSVRERGRISQEVQFSTLIERLINVPVARLHEAQKTNMERSYLWLQRARSLTGITEGDHIAAAAWAAHFRRHGDSRAAAEREFAKASGSHPFNFTTGSARVDYAIDFWIAAWFGLFATLIIVSNVALDRARTAGRVATSWRMWFQPVKAAMPGSWLGIVSFAVVAAALYIVILLRVASLNSEHETPHAVFVAGALLVIILTRRLIHLPAMVSSLKRNERVTMLLMSAIALVATMTAVRAINTRKALGEMPIGYADSIGNADIVADLEERLAKHPVNSLRYLTAVANDYAGNRDRAKALYAACTGDARAARALSALEQGRSLPKMPSPEEIFRALTAGESAWVAAAGNPPARVFNFVSWTTLAFAATLLIAGLFVRTRIEAEPAEVSSKWRLRLRKTALLLLPGYYDARYASLARGVIMLTLTGFTAWLAASFRAFRVPTAVGVVSAIDTPNFAAASPLPSDVQRLDLALSSPHAALFFIIVAVSVIALVTLHLTRLGRIRRYGREVEQGKAGSLTETLAQEA